MPSLAPMSLSELKSLNEELICALRSGVRLDLGLRESASSVTGRLSRVLNELAEGLANGKSLNEALDQLDPPVPSVYRVLVAVGLRGGQLESVLVRMNELSTILIDLHEMLRRATIYPISIAVMGYLLALGATFFCVPPLRAFLTDLRVEPSTSVKFTYFLHDTLLYWGIGIPLLVLILLLFRLLGAGLRRGSDEPWNWMSLMPGFRGLERDIETSRLASLLSIQTEYGLPWPESLRHCADSATSSRIRHFCLNAATQLEAGQPIAPLAESAVGVPPFLRWALSMSGTSSNLAADLSHVANTYRDRAIIRAEWLSRLVPTALSISLGSVIVCLYGWAVLSSLITVWEKVI